MGLEPNHGASKLKLMSYPFGAIDLNLSSYPQIFFIMVHPDFNLMSYPFGAMKLESIVLPLTNGIVTTQNEPRVAPTLILLCERTNKSKPQHLPVYQL